jgi:hypothetical protein
MMEALNMETRNTAPILANLLTTIQNSDISEHIYVNRSALQAKVLSVKEHPLPELLQYLGIRSLTLGAEHHLDTLNQLVVNLKNDPRRTTSVALL